MTTATNPLKCIFAVCAAVCAFSIFTPLEAANISGVAKFDGKPPRARPDKRIADNPDCHALHPDKAPPREELLVNGDGTLRNVFVYVKQGLEGKKFAAPATPVVIEQNGCAYQPRVVGVQVNQPLRIVNNDPLTHNTHAAPNANPGFNLAQTKGQSNDIVFKNPETMIYVKCDLHPWMAAYVGVLPHPFFAVTGDGGAFSLKGLPAGKYLIEARHEQLGAQTAEVKVAEGESKAIEFVFKRPPD